MCREDYKQYIMIVHDNTKKSRDIAKELSEGIIEQGALCLIQEEEKLPSVQAESNEEIEQDVSEDDQEDKISISVGIKDEEIKVYYKKSIDIPLLKYDIVDSLNEVEKNDFKVIGKNVAQLIELKPFINLLGD